MTRFAAFLAFITLTACADFPVLDGTLTDADRAARYPELVNIAPILAQARGAQNSDADEAAFQARLAALKARAERLRRLDI